MTACLANGARCPSTGGCDDQAFAVGGSHGGPVLLLCLVTGQRLHFPNTHFTYAGAPDQARLDAGTDEIRTDASTSCFGSGEFLSVKIVSPMAKLLRGWPGR